MFPRGVGVPDGWFPLPSWFLFVPPVIVIVVGGTVGKSGRSIRRPVLPVFVLQRKTTAAFAATPAGQTVIQTVTHTHPTVTAGASHTPDARIQGTPTHGPKTCPGLADAQNLAASYHLSTTSTGAAVTAICTLHDGTFKGATTAGVSVTADRVYGYGEIKQLLTYAQYLAAHDHANTTGKLSDINVSSYLADALHSCGSTPLEVCLAKHLPGFVPGTGHDNKPTTTPTPNGNAPTTTLTPNGNKPTGTPTPRH